MIDKIVPRKLSSSKDARVQGKDEMLDAINVTVNDSFGDFGDGEATGDAGVIKPAKGNEPVIVASDFFEPNTTKRTLGSVSDTRNNIIYFFIYSEIASEQGVYCVDQFGKLFEPSQNENGQYILHKVFTTSLFNFDSVSFVKGNIAHTSENNEGILYFTDDVNEPRKLNIKRALSGDVPEEEVDVTDFITACPKTPIPPPLPRFSYDSSRENNDFRNIEGYQFAYQCIYKDGEESSISTYSPLTYPASYATQGNSKTPDLKFYNKCLVTVSKFLNNVPAWTSEIKKIRLLGRMGNEGDFKAIDEKDVDGDNDVVFTFYNDEVMIAIPKEDEFKQFDNLPRKAKSQSIVNNRLLYGNYVEGYDDVGDVSESATIEAIYKPYINGENSNYSVVATPFVAAVAPMAGLGDISSNLVPVLATQFLANKKPAYLFDFSGLPSSVAAFSKLTFAITLRPDRRYDLYNGIDSFHTSRDMGVNAEGDPEMFSAAKFSNENTKVTSHGNPHHFQNNEGVSKVENGDSTSWTTIYDIPNTAGAGLSEFPSGQFANEEVDVVYGTSPSNALSIPAWNDLNFVVSIRYLQDISGGQLKADTANAITALLTGGSVPEELSAFIALDDDEAFDIAEVSSWNWNFIYNPESPMDAEQNTININDDAFQFVNSLARRDAVESSSPDQPACPCGFFIPNKGSVEFSLKRREDLEAALPDNNGTKTIVELDINSVNVEEEDIFTCLPEIDFDYNFNPNSPEGDVRVTSDNIKFRLFAPAYVQDSGLAGGFETTSSVTMMQSNLNYINPQHKSEYTPYVSFQENYAAGAVVLLTGFNTYYSYDESLPLGIYKDTEYNIQYQELTPDQTNGPEGMLGAVMTIENNFLSGNNLDRLRNCGVLKLNGRPFFDTNFGRFSMCDGEVNSWKGGFGEDMLSVGYGQTLGGSSSENGIKLNYLFSESGDLPEMGVFDNLGFGFGSVGSDYGGSIFEGYESLHFIFGIIYGCDFFARSNGEFAFGDSNPRDYPLVLGNESFAAGNHVYQGFGFEQNNFNLAFQEDEPGQDSELFVDYFQNNKFPQVELKGAPVLNFFAGQDESRYSSFKTNANHDFGITYYDERGRAGFVNKLGKVYVEGYSPQERGMSGYEGPVEIKISLGHEPPPWAKHYQIMYAKNSSVADFLFYSTGTAFVPPSLEESEDGVIYVSLNYLQENIDVSYAEVFGGIAKDGTRSFYKFKEGDRLRIHSYSLDPAFPDNKIYPKDIEFDIVGAELLTNNPEENPLVNDDNIGTNGTVHPAYQGMFLKLKDNPSELAEGFNFESVSTSQINEAHLNDKYQSNAGPFGNKWRSHCIVEIFSPTVKRDAEERVFYETSKVYNVIETGNVLFHESDAQSIMTPEITLKDGDVYFRRMAVNYNKEEPLHPAMDFHTGPYGLIDELVFNNKSTPNFKSTFLESQTFTDMFSGADVYSIGKIKTIAPNAKEIRRDASIKYSDKNTQEITLLRFTSFNDSKLPFKDMPNENGSIQAIIDYDDSLFCIQEDKCSSIPVERNILADASGTQNLIGSTEVLGTERFYAGNYGTDHQESVVLAENSIYFASETNYEVYRFHPSNGLMVISDQGMRSFFKDLFRDVRAGVDDKATFMKVVGGYNPESEEYVLTVYSIPLLFTRIVPDIELPDGGVGVGLGDEDEDEGEDEGPDLGEEEQEEQSGA